MIYICFMYTYIYNIQYTYIYIYTHICICTSKATSSLWVDNSNILAVRLISIRFSFPFGGVSL